MTRFATETLIFVVLKLGLVNIAEETERMKFAFFFSCIFLSDFISYWFQVYSSYLIDQEPHKCSNPFLQVILSALRFPLVDLAMTGLAEIYVFCYYMSFFQEEFSQITSHPQYQVVRQLALYGIILKTIHNCLHLIVSSLRIVNLDVQTKNNTTTN